MKTKLTTALVVALGALALAANAQDNNSSNDGPPGADGARPGMRQHAGPMGQPGFHLLPPFAERQLKLTDDQKTQVAALEKETKAKLEKILTADQLEQLKSMRPPMRERGGPGMRDGQGGFRDNGQHPPMGQPPGEGNGNNPPPDGPPGDQ